MKLKYISSFALVLAAADSIAAPVSNYTAYSASATTLYFGYAFPPRIERYSIASETWLAPIALKASVYAVTEADGALWIGHPQNVLKADLNGLNATEFAPVANTKKIHVGANKVFLAAGFSGIVSFDALTGASLGTNSCFSADFANGEARFSGQTALFSYTTSGVSPSDVGTMILSGTNAVCRESPYHGAYPQSGKTRLSLDSANMLDLGGVIYNVGTLNFSGAFGTGAVAGTALSNGWVVSRANGLARLANNGAELGRYAPLAGVKELQLSGNSILAVRDVQGTLQISKFAADSEMPAPAQIIALPTNLAYEVDAVYATSDGDVVLINKPARAVYLWSRRLRQYELAVQLDDTPLASAFNPLTKILTVSYATGQIAKLNLTTALERPFAFTSTASAWLIDTGDLVIACDHSGAWASHWVFDTRGNRVNWLEWNHCTGKAAWDPTNRRVFQITAFSPTDVEYEQFDISGALLARGQAPSHGGVSYSGFLTANPSGNFLFSGAGQVFDVPGLNIVGTLNFSANSIVWAGTLPYAAIGNKVRALDTSYQSRWEESMPGARTDLLSANQAVVTVTRRTDTGVPEFRVFSANEVNADVEIGVTQPIIVANGMPTWNVVVANLSQSQSATAALNSPAQISGLDTLTWSCTASGGATCASTNGTGSLPASVTLPAQGVLRFSISANLTTLTNNTPVTYSAVLPADPRQDNNLVQSNFRVVDVMFTSGFEN